MREPSKIEKLRELLQERTAPVFYHEYDNVNDYAQYFARNLSNMIEYRRQEVPEARWMMAELNEHFEERLPLGMV